MPLDLAALLVEAATVSADDMERALQRSRELGGSLDTALLELELVRGDELERFLSRTSGLPPAPPGLAVDEDAAAVLPARVAERHRLAPFRLEDGELSLLAAHPVDLTAIDEIGFMLSLHLVPHVAPEWRVRALMARAYATPLAARFAALAARLGDGAAAPGPAPVRGTAPPVGAEAPADGADALATGPASDPAADPRALSRTWELGRADPPEPMASALARAAEALDVSALLRDVIGPEPVPEAPPGWSRSQAFAALDAAQDRDEVLSVVLRYARDFVEAVAILGVSRGQAVGVDAIGWPDARARCREVRLDAGGAGLLRAVLDTRGPYLGPVARDPGNDALLAALGRAPPAAALVYPVVLRERPVCVVYADNGEAPVSPARVGDLVLLLGGVGHALERVLLEGKRARAAPAPAVKDAAGWDLRERARLAPPEVRSVGGDEPFQVAPASQALSEPRPGAARPAEQGHRDGGAAAERASHGEP